MKLDDYVKKRNFNNTPEPPGEVGKGDAHRFVIQRHDARALHYDLRLEMEGVLKCWAVPKGPSLNPHDKRLAIQTEDHPVKYLDFEGTIPKGNYGAGDMEIWDEGTYKAVDGQGEKELSRQLKKGRLTLEFNGKKIRGAFSLVRTRWGEDDKQWLLIKKKDRFATDMAYDAETYRPAPKDPPKVIALNPESPLKPMLATSVKKIFNDPGWLYELKWDGYRMIANISEREVRLYSRNGLSFNAKFPSLLRSLKDIQQDVILDGEVVIIDQQGRPQFQYLQNYADNTPGELRYYVFDLLFLNGISMLELPLKDRKSFLPELLEGLDRVFYCEHVVGMGTALYEKALKAGMEGVIAKKADTPYIPGHRSENWLKVKSVQSQEAIICGYTDSVKKGTIFGSLILGIWKEGRLTYIGNSGSGFSNEEQRTLLTALEAIETQESPFKDKIDLKGRNPHWVEPRLICEVKFSEWTKAGMLRHPIYKGLRNDKTLHEITHEKMITNKKRSGGKKNTSNHLEVDGVKVPVTHPDKVYWPESGLRKYDLIDYYLNIADLILPYLKDRPQNLHRHPDGIEKKGFYQKDYEGPREKWIETTAIYSESSEREVHYLLCQNLPTLVYMANLGCIELNPWTARIASLDHPDYLVIDLDPSGKNTFEEVIEVAQATKEVLDLIKVKSYCKTSGSRGIHIHIPLEAKYTFEEARNFTKLICQLVHEQLPKLTSMERAVKKRKDKIYLDYMQNVEGQSIAAPYCVRPKPGAPVSAPLKWSEVKQGLRISDFNIHSMPKRMKRRKDPFAPVLGKGIDMAAALEKLEKTGV